MWNRTGVQGAVSSFDAVDVFQMVIQMEEDGRRFHETGL